MKVKVWEDIQNNVNNSRKERDSENIEQNEQVKSAPTTVFSVIGDSHTFVLRSWPINVFQSALIEAAKSGGETWIFFRGYKTGVSKIILDAYRHYEVMELGNNKMAINDRRRHIKLISIAGKNDDRTYNGQIPKYYTATEGEGNEFLIDFEKFVSDQKVHLFGQAKGLKMPISIAIIVCEGDIETISHISQALTNKIPVIIMKGSGKAADLVSDYLQTKRISRKKAGISFGIPFDDQNNANKKYADLKQLLKSIAKKSNMIGVFDLDRDDPLMLSSIIGETVVGCWSMDKSYYRENSEFIVKETRIPEDKSKDKNEASQDPERNMKSFEGSRDYVYHPKYTTPTSLPLSFFFGYHILHESKQWDERGHTLLLEALKGNRCDYVKGLLDQEVNFKMMNLAELYEQTFSCQVCTSDDDFLHIHRILKKFERSSKVELVYKYECSNAKDGEDAEKENMKTIPNNTVIKAARKLCNEILKQNEDNLEENNEDTNIDISDILLWAIYANRRELAEICWLKGKNHLMTGLLCSAMLKKLSKKADKVKEHSLTMDLEEHSKLFEQRCIALMDRMFEEDRTSAISLMDTSVGIWGFRSSPLTFAYEHNMLGIVSQPCSQKSMREMWYKKVAPDFIPFLKSFCKEPKFFLAPMTHYILNYFMFFTMLIMYSAFVLTSVSTKYYEHNIGRIFEYYVYFWSVGDLIEELISCFGWLESAGRSNRGWWDRIKRYISEFWNFLDLLSHVLLIVAFCVRYFYVDETFTIARRMFALSLLVMYLRFLGVFLIFRKMGLTLIMIKEMLTDLLSFLAVASFVVLGVGIYYHANLWPDHQSMWSGDWTDWRIWTIIYYPYWQLYAEMNFETLEATDPENCTNVRAVWEADPSQNRCPHADWTVKGVAAIFLLFSNLLLVNLVIAKFSYTFEKVQENSEKIWHFEKYRVLSDYEWRIPAPINLFFLPYRLTCRRKDKCRRECKIEDGEKDADLEVLHEFEKIMALRIFNKR